MNDGFRNPAHLVHRFAHGKPVYGVQPVGDKIYIIRDSSSNIEVYDRAMYYFSEDITVDGMKGPYDMVQSNEDTSSLFIADWFNQTNLFKVQVPQGNSLQWSFQENGQTTLGLAGACPLTGPNILVTASASNRLKEFSPTGQRIQQLVIQGISSPRQGIKVADNSYAICHGYGPPPELHRVCLVDGQGVITGSHGTTSGTGADKLNVPARLELGRNGYILVADSGNGRVVLLDRNLHYIRDLISGDLDRPYRLYFDQAYDLLFVADNWVNADGKAVSGNVAVFRI